MRPNFAGISIKTKKVHSIVNELKKAIGTSLRKRFPSSLNQKPNLLIATLLDIGTKEYFEYDEVTGEMSPDLEFAANLVVTEALQIARDNEENDLDPFIQAEVQPSTSSGKMVIFLIQ